MHMETSIVYCMRKNIHTNTYKQNNTRETKKQTQNKETLNNKTKLEIRG